MKRKILSLALVLSLSAGLAVPALAVYETPTFPDMPKSHWAYTYVEQAAENGWISGNNGYFMPDETVTYAQMCVMLVSAFFTKELGAYIGPSQPWYEPFCAVASRAGLLKNTNIAENPTDAAMVNQLCTRQEMALIVYNALKSIGATMPSSDVLETTAMNTSDIAYYLPQYMSPIVTTKAMGIISGVDSKGSFAGRENMTRAQAAVVLVRTADVLKNGDNVTGSEEATVPSGGSKGFVIQNNVVIDYTGTDSIVVIPNGVTAIGERAFDYCTTMTSVVIPNSVTSIGPYAFQESGLTSVTIPDSVTTLGEGAFSQCKALATVVIGSGVTEIWDQTFVSCEKLTNVTMSDRVTTLGYRAFGLCSSLSNFEMPSSILYIGKEAFASDPLTSFYLPDTVLFIGKNVCTSTLIDEVRLPNPPPDAKLSNGQSISAANIQAILNEVKGSYPEGMSWGDYAEYTSHYDGAWGNACLGFVIMCRDAVFGEVVSEINHSDFDAIRPGDHVRYDSHSVFVMEKRENSIIVAEGNYASKVHWGREITRAELEKASFYMATSYYPYQIKEIPKPGPGAASTGMESPSRPADPPTNEYGRTEAEQKYYESEIHCAVCNYLMKPANSTEFDTNGSNSFMSHTCGQFYLCHRCMDEKKYQEHIAYCTSGV